MIRPRVEERMIPRNNLMVDPDELSDLIVDDKIAYKITNENKIGMFLKLIEKLLDSFNFNLYFFRDCFAK